MNELLNRINNKSRAWYERLCSKKVVRYGVTCDKESIAVNAAIFAYRSSISQALYCDHVARGFKGISTKDKKDARAEAGELISNYIINNFDSNYDMNQVYDLMTSVRSVYHRHGVYWYTYGNAQKFVSMSFKYFFNIMINKGLLNLNDENLFRGYNYSVVDRQMIKMEKNVSFADTSWSNCDDLEEFKRYQSGLLEQYADKYGNLCFYEIDSWIPRNN